MLLTVVWGMSGMLAVLLLVFMGVAFLLVGLEYAGEGGLGAWKALGCYALSGSCAVVDDTSGTSYDTNEDVYLQLDKGDRVRCRATSPLLFLEATILSCKRAPKR